MLPSPVLWCKEIWVSPMIVEMWYQLSWRKEDAQSVTNWTTVGQLSWQYLRAPMLDHCSLSQWSSSSVYRTIPSCGFISDSWSCFWDDDQKHQSRYTCGAGAWTERVPDLKLQAMSEGRIKQNRKLTGNLRERAEWRACKAECKINRPLTYKISYTNLTIILR